MAANQPQIYMGQMSVSDVIADVWKSCIYMPALDATFNATWYFTGKTSSFLPRGVVQVKFHIKTAYHIYPRGAWIAQCLERRTRDRKVPGSNPGRSGARIFFSGVNFLC